MKPQSRCVASNIVQVQRREKPMSIRTKAMIAAIAIVSFIAASATGQQDFTFTTSGGQPVTLSSLRGKVAVLLFSGAQDPQCREGLAALQSLVKRYQGKDVNIYWVSVNPASEMTNDQLKSPCGVATAVPILRDANGAAFKRFSSKTAQLPTVVVLDRQGNPSGQPRGGFNPNSDFVNDVASTVDGLLGR